MATTAMMRRNSTSRRVQTFSSAWIRSDDIAADIPPSRDEVSDMRSAHDRKQALWDDGWTGMTGQWRLFKVILGPVARQNQSLNMAPRTRPAIGAFPQIK